jgi:LysR family hca operon transcriptional activator
MELRHLRYFVAVADELSFTKGAEKLRIAQPSLTRQIRDLEEELGVQLLDRTKKRVLLTRQGAFFLQGAKRLLGYSAEIVQSVHDLDRKTSAMINIGYVPNPFHRVLPATLTEFEKKFQEISINLFGMSPLEQVSAIREGKLDIGFVGLMPPAAETDLETQIVGSYPAVLLLSRRNALAKKAIVKLPGVGSLSFISLSDKCYPGYERWLRGTCEKLGVRCKILQTVDTESTLLQIVGSGLGVALLPYQIKDASHENIAIKPVNPAECFSSCAMWKKANQSPVLKSYLEVLDRVSKKINRSSR